MALEIERKFLVQGDFESHAIASHHIVQGYIAGSDNLTVRVRVLDTKGFLTIKGRSDAAGLERDEWEWEIEAEEALALLRFSRGTIDKRRSRVRGGPFLWRKRGSCDGRGGTELTRRGFCPPRMAG